MIMISYIYDLLSTVMSLTLGCKFTFELREIVHIGMTPSDTGHRLGYNMNDGIFIRYHYQAVWKYMDNKMYIFII